MAPVGPVAEVVLGVADPPALIPFLSTFGLGLLDQVHLDADQAELLTGRPAGTGAALRLASPHAPDRSTVLVVPTAAPSAPVTGWTTGPRALDLYSADLDVSLAAVEAAGLVASPEAVLAGGPMRMRQVLVGGPEGLGVVLVDSTHRRSSVCDLPEAPLHSEPHSVVWCVPDHAGELARWVAAGWTAGATISFSEPTVSDELGLPERPTPITMTMLSDPDVGSVRVELLSFDDHPSPVDSEPTSAVASLLVRVDSVGDAVDRWGDGAAFGPPTALPSSGTAVAGTAVAGTTRGGVRLVLVGAG